MNKEKLNTGKFETLVPRFAAPDLILNVLDKWKIEPKEEIVADLQKELRSHDNHVVDDYMIMEILVDLDDKDFKKFSENVLLERECRT